MEVLKNNMVFNMNINKNTLRTEKEKIFIF